MKIDHAITRFITNQTSATVCCVSENGLPCCFSCFYLFNPDEALLYFKSSASSEHARYLKNNPEISGTVLPDSLNKLIVQGIQFRGIVIDAEDQMAKDAAVHYHSRYPMALAMNGKVYTIRIDSIKLTDSSRVFAKKSTWNRELEKVESISTITTNKN